MIAPSKPFILAAIDALKLGDRDQAVFLLRQNVDSGPFTADRWKSIHRLASDIGEIDMALECARQYAATQPDTISFQLFYWGELVNYGRITEAIVLSDQFPSTPQSQTSLAHFRGTLATIVGQFDRAEAQFRAVVDQAPHAAQSWFAMAMIKTFRPDDPDLTKMQMVVRQLAGKNAEAEAPLHYAIAKAHNDLGDYQNAMRSYEQGAAIKRTLDPYNRAQQEAAVKKIITDFTVENLARLVTAEERPCRALFVTGMPRSGTTLVEQILTTHSFVSDGGEINLLRASLTSNNLGTWDRAMAQQATHPGQNGLWSKVAHDYHHMLKMRFGGEGLVVDKTLMQSRFMGFLLHALPSARVVWMRRKPADVALSCYRAYFTASLPWSWSFADIAHFMALEDQLFDHWQSVAGERILAVVYEDLVSDPNVWIRKIAHHVGLSFEDGMLASHQNQRAVRTASVHQVRQPITVNAIGKSAHYADFMKPYF